LRADWPAQVAYWCWILHPLVSLVAPWFGHRRVLPYAFGIALLAPGGAVTSIVWLLSFGL
jgi:hypothetical protein